MTINVCNIMQKILDNSFLFLNIKENTYMIMKNKLREDIKQKGRKKLHRDFFF